MLGLSAMPNLSSNTKTPAKLVEYAQPAAPIRATTISSLIHAPATDFVVVVSCTPTRGRPRALGFRDAKVVMEGSRSDPSLALGVVQKGREGGPRSNNSKNLVRKQRPADGDQHLVHRDE